MSENEQEVVPVKIAEVADVLKYTVGDKYAVHVVMTSPPEVSLNYCFRTMGWWILASVCWSLIIGAVGFVVMLILAMFGVVR